MLCFKDSRRFLHAIEVAVVQFAQVHLVNVLMYWVLVNVVTVMYCQNGIKIGSWAMGCG